MISPWAANARTKSPDPKTWACCGRAERYLRLADPNVALDRRPDGLGYHSAPLIPSRMLLLSATPPQPILYIR